MAIDPTLSGLAEDALVDGTEIIRTIGRDGSKASSVAGLVAAGMALSGINPPYAAPLLATYRKAKSLLLTGTAANVRIAFVGDSKTRGAGAGTANGAGQQLTGAAMKAKPFRVGQLLAAAGLPVINDTWFGAGGAPSVPDAVAYDPRLSGFTGWTAGATSLGGVALATNSIGSNPGNFAPLAAVDRVSLFTFDNTTRGALQVAKGGETFTITPTDATGRFTRTDLSFATKDTGPIALTKASGANNTQVFGLIAWDSAKPGIEVCNFGVFGVTSAYQADTTAATSPANALAVYAPHLTVINLGTNDLGGAVQLATYIANISVLIGKAQLSGDVILTWPAIAGVSGNGGTDAARAVWKEALRGLAAASGCMFVDEEALFGGRAGAVAQAWFADSLHESAAAYYAEAVSLARLLNAA